MMALQPGCHRPIAIIQVLLLLLLLSSATCGSSSSSSSAFIIPSRRPPIISSPRRFSFKMQPLQALKIRDAFLFFDQALKKWGLKVKVSARRHHHHDHDHHHHHHCYSDGNAVAQPIEEDPDVDPDQRRIWGGLYDPHEDLDSRPDIKQAKAIAKEKQKDYGPQNAVSVSLYFQVSPWHLQSFREAAQVRYPVVVVVVVVFRHVSNLHLLFPQDFVDEQRSKYGTDRMFWEAFQYIPIPSTGNEDLPGRYPGRLAGVTPQRCRILLQGSFMGEEAEDLAKKEVTAWKDETLKRLEALEILPEDQVLDIPLAQVTVVVVVVVVVVIMRL